MKSPLIRGFESFAAHAINSCIQEGRTSHPDDRLEATRRTLSILATAQFEAGLIIATRQPLLCRLMLEAMAAEIHKDPTESEEARAQIVEIVRAHLQANGFPDFPDPL